jgi:hypothetical protein
MRKLLITFCTLTTLVLFVACSSKSDSPKQREAEEEKESLEAKKLLQGIWVDDETGEVSFRAAGDTIFYPDTISQPTLFRIVKDSLVLVDVGAKYPIVKQSANWFCIKNQNGDEVRLQKSNDPIHAFAFVRDQPRVQTYTEVVKTDSVVHYNGARYHWYLVINPTKYKVQTTSYNEDGVEVDNVYYDNIMHVSVFQGAQKMFSTDFKKQLFASKIPQEFLDQSVLSNMEFTKVDTQGFHFVATICIPDGAACYKAENTISFDGKLTTTLIEY